MIRLQIITGDVDTNGLVTFASFWNNLFKASSGASAMLDWAHVDQFVQENYNGRVIFDDEEFGERADCIEFDTEKEATAFLLRWA